MLIINTLINQKKLCHLYAHIGYFKSTMCILLSAKFNLENMLPKLHTTYYFSIVTIVFALSTVDLLFRQMICPAYFSNCSIIIFTVLRFDPFVVILLFGITLLNFGLLRALTSCDVTDCIALVAPSIHKLCIPLPLIAFLSQPKLGLTLYNLLLESNSRITNQTPVKSWVNIGPC